MGGTLGMKPNEEGARQPDGAVQVRPAALVDALPTFRGALEPAPGYLLSRMREMREFAEDEMPAVHEPLLDSSDMGPPEWIGIVEVLHRHYYDYDGFVVIMGTDTMAYAASAASFMMENLGKPVVFTGSMVPLCELYNDAKRNLVVACILAGYVDVPEVTLFINSTLFRGNRVTKVSYAPPSRAQVWQGLLPGGGQPLQDQVDSHGLDAFDSPNYAPLVRLATGFRVNFAAFRPQPKGRFRISTELCDEIAVLRMVPGFSDNYINAIIEHTPTIRGIVLQLYGTGNAAQRNGSFMAAVQAAIRRGIMVVATTQCAKGGVKLETYA
ncbi:ansA [Symbiodinium sp. KB8]|nr:ansA [Symbiodinium sp. KB8]